MLLFRKRPSETHSGPGLMTPTDAVAVVRLQHQVRSRPAWRASRRGYSLATSTFHVALHKGSCLKSLSSHFPSLASSPASLAAPRQSLLQTTTAPRNHQSYSPPKQHKGCLVWCLQQRTADRSPREADKVRCSGNVHQVCRRPLALQTRMHLGV